jgi:transposase-like protein
MPRRAPIPKCSEEDKELLQQLAASRTEEARLVERAKIILKCLQGERVHKIARDLHIRPNTVIDWRRRFEKEGVKGLKDQPRSGKPARYDAVFRGGVLNTSSAVRASPLGWACSCKTSRYIGARCLAPTAQRRNLSESPTQLVCKH